MIGCRSGASTRADSVAWQSYFGMVKCIDDNVGEVLNALRAQGLIDKTIVVFTSDHGDLRGEHHRQNKSVPYEGSARIPFIIYAPARIQAGTVVDEALGCVDFLPTILRLMGVPTVGREQGRDASTLLTTGKPPADWHDIVFIRGTGKAMTWLAAVTDRYKLVFSAAADPWLFDLQEDPDELTNFFANPAYQQTVRELADRILEYGKEYHDPYIDDAGIKADLQAATRE